MRILIHTGAGLAERLRRVLRDHELTTEPSPQHVDVACFDVASGAMDFARAQPNSAVYFFGAYTHMADLLEAGVADVVPCDENLEARVQIAVARLERTSAAFEARLVTLIDESQDGITITTDQKIAFANRAFKEMLLDGDRNLAGRSWASLTHPEDVARLHADNEACTLSGEPTKVTEARLLRSDGTALWVRNWAMPLTFRGRPSVIRFIRAAVPKQKLDDQMLLADRMASVGTLAAGVAHELNNPLAYVLANLQMLRESLPETDNAKVIEELDSAIQGAHRMSDIVRDLKTFTREPTTTTEVVDVVSTLRTALHMCENELRHRGTVELKLVEGLFVEINASRLCQVFVNLLINAAQAIDETEHGLVQVSAGLDERGWARIAIQDNGPGIPAEDMGRIFEPFFTTKAAFEGTGLGLSICRNLVTQAHGELHVESAPGAGARFTVYLPTTTRKREEKTKSSPPANASARILIIDDEQLIGRAMKRALSQHRVTVTTDGADALVVLAQQSFDLIFCDLMMPGLSGMDVFESAVAKDASLDGRFVFMTGGAFTPAAQAFIANRSSQVLEKPFDLKKVREIAAQFATSSS